MKLVHGSLFSGFKEWCLDREPDCKHKWCRVVLRSLICFAAEVIQFWALKSAHILNWAGAIVQCGWGLRKTNVLWTEVDSRLFALKACKAQGKLFAKSQSRRLHLDYADSIAMIDISCSEYTYLDPQSSVDVSWSHRESLRLERHKTWYYECDSIHSSIFEWCHSIMLSGSLFAGTLLRTSMHLHPKLLRMWAAESRYLWSTWVF